MINPSERYVAQYILNQPEKMIGMTVSELAEASGSSQSAVIRLCKNLGLKGYQNINLRVAGDLHNPKIGDE